MKSMKLKITSMILVATMLFSIVPPDFALASKKTEPDINYQEEKIEYDVPYRGEIKAKRKENEKHFVREDGLIEAVIYNTPVHYIDKEGNLEEINNKLKSANDDEGNEELVNKGNTFEVKFSKKAKSKKLVTIKKGKSQLSWALDGISDKSSAKEIKKEAKKLKFSDNAKLNAKLQKNQELREIENFSSGVTYSDILQDVDLEYEIIGQTLKENIIIKKKDETDTQDKYIYNFNLELKKLEIKHEKGKIDLVNPKTGEVVFSFSQMFMTDAKENYSDKVDISVIKQDEKGKELKNPILRINADDEWIESIDREFPVKIDPIVSGTTSSVIEDTFISQAYPDSNFANHSHNEIGKSGTDQDRIMFVNPVQSLVNFRDETVVNAKITMHLQATGANNGDNPLIIGCKQVAYLGGIEGVSSIEDLTWNNSGSRIGYIADLLGYERVEVVPEDKQTGKYFDFDIISYYRTLQDRYADDEENNFKGVGLEFYQAEDEEGDTPSSSLYYFDTSDAGAYGTTITVTYRNLQGMNKLREYNTIDMGRSGTAHISKDSGSLVYVHNDVELTGSSLYMDISHAYNPYYSSKEAYSYTDVGTNWKLNVEQYVGVVNDNLLYYIDEANTLRYFNKEGDKYICEDDETLVIEEKKYKFWPEGAPTVQETEYYQLSNNDEYKYNFYRGYNGIYKLLTIDDEEGNWIYSIEYDGLSNELSSELKSMSFLSSFRIQLTRIIDRYGREIIPEYDSNSRLVALKDTKNQVQCQYLYDNDGFLEEIEYIDGKKTQFQYNSDGKLCKVIAIDGRSAIFNYALGSVISSYKEQGTNGGITNHRALSFRYNNTKIKNLANGIIIEDYYYDYNSMFGIEEEEESDEEATSTPIPTTTATPEPTPVETVLINGNETTKIITYPSNKRIIESETSNNGLYLVSSKDERGKQTLYNYDRLTGELYSETDANGNTTEYTYNNVGLQTSVKQGNTTINYSYQNDRIDEIILPAMKYKYGYDEFGENNSIKIKNIAGDSEINLFSKTFYSATSLLASETYGNNNTVNYVYDSDENLREIKHNGNVKYQYTYYDEDAENTSTPLPIEENAYLKYTDKYMNENTYYYWETGEENESNPQYLKVKTNGDFVSARWTEEDDNAKVTNYKVYDDRNGSVTDGYIFTKTDDGYYIKYNLLYSIKFPSYTTDENGTFMETTTISHADISGDSFRIDTTSDELGRLTNKSIGISGPKGASETYSYYDDIREENTTTHFVKKIEYLQRKNNSYPFDDSRQFFEYTYDNVGNILSVIDENNKFELYEYDTKNQLTIHTRKDGKAEQYQYNNQGNIISKKLWSFYGAWYAPPEANVYPEQTATYQYNHPVWKDQLTSYNGNQITYDGAGNPINYYNGYKFDWVAGRRLSNITKSTAEDISFTYNEDGIRTSKTRVIGSGNMLETTYELEGSDVVVEKNHSYIQGTSETHNYRNLYYMYDDEEELRGFYLYQTDYLGIESAENGFYYYKKNLQGDIIGILDESLNEVVKYEYDAWGKIISITGSKASTVGAYNPYRYRGYRYDSDIGLYYLQSRYYDPEIGRFINADSTNYIDISGTVLGCNMYAYCENNPVYSHDPDGFWSTSIHYKATEIIACELGFTKEDAKFLATFDKFADNSNVRNGKKEARCTVKNTGVLIVTEEESSMIVDLIYIFEGVEQSGIKINLHNRNKTKKIKNKKPGLHIADWSGFKKRSGLEKTLGEKYIGQTFLKRAKKCKKMNKIYSLFFLAWGLHSLQDFYAHRGKHSDYSDKIEWDYKFVKNANDGQYDGKAKEGEKYIASNEEVKYNTEYSKIDKIFDKIDRTKYMSFRKKKRDNNYRVRRTLDVTIEYIGEYLDPKKNYSKDKKQKIRKEVYGKIYK